MHITKKVTRLCVQNPYHTKKKALSQIEQYVSQRFLVRKGFLIGSFSLSISGITRKPPRGVTECWNFETILFCYPVVIPHLYMDYLDIIILELWVLSKYQYSRTMIVIRNHKDLSYCYVNYYYLIPDFYDSPIISQPESRVDSFDDACLVYILLWTTYGYT